MPLAAAATTPHRRLHLAGIAILIAGWVCAAIVFAVAERGDAAGAADRQLLNGQVYEVPMDASKRELQQVERMGGKATVRMLVFENWLGSLWHGTRLAGTLALLSTAAGGLCIYLASLAAESDVGTDRCPQPGDRGDRGDRGSQGS